MEPDGGDAWAYDYRSMNIEQSPHPICDAVMNQAAEINRLRTVVIAATPEDPPSVAVRLRNLARGIAFAIARKL